MTAFVKPSLGTNTTNSEVYTAADKSWVADQALLVPGALRTVEPLNRSFHVIADWIDGVTQDTSLIDSDKVLAHNLAAQSAITAITDVADNDSLSKIIKLLEYRADNRMLKCFPVGSLYFHTVDTNPGTFLGGTWEAYSAGRVLVGVDAGDTDFHEAGHTGGSKDAVVLTHQHLLRFQYADTSGAGLMSDVRTGNATDGGQAYTDAAGVADTGNQNLPPYVVVYIWRRTA
jgi:hypothetical protein